MSNHARLRALFALLAATVARRRRRRLRRRRQHHERLSATAASGELIQTNPDNTGVQLTIGSKNFTEQYHPR